MSHNFRQLCVALWALLVLLHSNEVIHARVNPPPHDPPYPAAWWGEVSREGAPGWEIFPQDAAYGEVILSKRTELGLFSNFAATPFVFRDRPYASMEGFWQSLKYPEDEQDERFKDPSVTWVFTRDEVTRMTGFAAKRAGDLASENMLKLNIDWVTLDGEKMNYKQSGPSTFYFLIVNAMRAKLEQNPHVYLLLNQTGGLILRPDHDTSPKNLMAWQYYQIWMDFRDLSGYMSPVP